MKRVDIQLFLGLCLFFPPLVLRETIKGENDVKGYIYERVKPVDDVRWTRWPGRNLTGHRWKSVRPCADNLRHKLLSSGSDKNYSAIFFSSLFQSQTIHISLKQNKIIVQFKLQICLHSWISYLFSKWNLIDLLMSQVNLRRPRSIKS
jgi:hypothetical protein